MYTLFTVIHVLISAALILVILTQSSKGGALDGFIGGTATSMLGGQGASKFLKNATRILAFLFMLSCFLLAFQLKGGKAPGAKVVDKLKKEVAEDTQTEEELPALPETEDPLPGTGTE
ncbi:MAG: preprotein translocase subunit SecG [Candidatus Cloacimonetes bacterium]|nr:preprotein translocase subunit SecG [Candidatus Cloacimonadota bacterium]